MNVKTKTKLTRNVLVPVHRSDNGRAISQADTRSRRGREQSLQKCDRGVDDRTALAAIVRSDEYLPVIYDIWGDTVDCVGRVRVEVLRAKVRPELDFLSLNERLQVKIRSDRSLKRPAWPRGVSLVYPCL